MRIALQDEYELAQATIGRRREPGHLPSTQRWLIGLLQRRNANVATVALANKNARTAWALLAHAKPYEPGHA